MSDYKADSDLSRLNREGHGGAVPVDPSLYAVVAESLVFSRRSGGAFDVTIAPLLKAWRKAAEEGRQPSADEIAQARRCVGYEHIDLVAPDRIGFRSDAWKSTSVALARDTPWTGRWRSRSRRDPARTRQCRRQLHCRDWCPAGKRRLAGASGRARSGGRVLLLKDNSVSTSQQDPPSLPRVSRPRRHNQIPGRQRTKGKTDRRAATRRDHRPRARSARGKPLVGQRRGADRHDVGRPLDHLVVLSVEQGKHCSRSSQLFCGMALVAGRGARDVSQPGLELSMDRCLHAYALARALRLAPPARHRRARPCRGADPMDTARRSPASDASVCQCSSSRRVIPPRFVRRSRRVIASTSSSMPAALATFVPPAQGLAAVVVKGNATSAAGGAAAPARAANARVLTLDERGKWPHIRSNWVTRNNDVLQVAAAPLSHGSKVTPR